MDRMLSYPWMCCSVVWKFSRKPLALFLKKDSAMTLREIASSLLRSAQRRPVGAARSSEAGFSLIEIIIVLGILGTLIAVLIGNIGGGAEKAKVKATTVKAGQVQQNLLKYQSDLGKMPTTAEGLSVLITSPGSGKWGGPYGSEEDLKDDWGNAFEYELTAKGAKLTSPGLDGQVGTEDDLVYVGGRLQETAPAAGEAPAQ
jgi:general secretion pathway protein G